MNDDRYLSPIVVQSIGACLIIAAFIFWMVTGRQSELMVGAALTLIAFEAARGAHRTYRATRADTHDADAAHDAATREADE